LSNSPTLGGEDCPRKADRDDRQGKDAVPRIDPSDPIDVCAGHGQADDADLEGKDAGEQEDQQVMRNGQVEIGRGEIHDTSRLLNERAQTILHGRRDQLKDCAP
jgi:hypothetical protein